VPAKAQIIIAIISCFIIEKYKVEKYKKETVSKAIVHPPVLHEAVSKVPFRHYERSEAIHKSLLMIRIASVFDPAITVKRAFDTPSNFKRGIPRQARDKIPLRQFR
jgi:hypothetical protein